MPVTAQRLALATLLVTLVSVTAQSETSGTCGRVHAVASGDLCWDIATMSGLSVEALLSLNPGVNCDALQLGQELCTAPCSRAHTVVSGDTCFDIAVLSGLTLQQLQAINPGVDCSDLLPGQQLCAGPCGQAYAVQQGDTCEQISTTAGLNLTQLQALNPTLNCTQLQSNQALCLNSTISTNATSIPSPTTSPSAPSPSSSSRPQPCGRAHTLVEGDLCGMIAISSDLTLDALLSLNPGVDCNTLQPGQQLCTGPCSQLHTVASGDLCSGIAQQYDLSLSQLQALNLDLTCSDLQPGQAVCVRRCAWVSAVQPGETCTSIGQVNSFSSLDQLLNLNPGLNCSALQPDQPLCMRLGSACGWVHSIQPGDTCYTLSLLAGRDSTDALVGLNPGINCTALQIGQRVCVAEQHRSCLSTHTAEAEQSCELIAALYNITVEQLQGANPDMTCEGLAVGQVLCIPSPSSPSPPRPPLSCARRHLVSAQDTCDSISLAYGAGDSQALVQLNPQLNCSVLVQGDSLCIWGAPSCLRSQSVASGDTCPGVSAAAGITVAQLQYLNPLMICDALRVDQQLCVASDELLSPPPPSPAAADQGSSTSSTGSSSSSMAVGVGVGVGLGLALIFGVLAAVWWMRRRRSKPPTADGGGKPDRPTLPGALKKPSQGKMPAGGIADADAIVVSMEAAGGRVTGSTWSNARDTGSTAKSGAELMSEATAIARKEQIVSALAALSHIDWMDITGPMGAGSPLVYLCQGGYGVVFKGKWQDEDVVVKRVEHQSMDAAKAYEELSREAYIMASCKHPNVAQIYGLTQEPSTGTSALVMRYYCRGSLRDVLDNTPNLTLATKLRMARDVAWAMQYLHSRHHEMIVHGDLKTTNLLVDDSFRVHISDFGLASMKTATRTIAPNTSARSVVFAAPEILQQLGSTTSSNRTMDADVYAFAMVLFELFTGVCPFHGASEGQIVGVVLAGLRPTIPLLGIGEEPSTEGMGAVQMSLTCQHVPVPIAHLMERCWSQDPTFRPRFDQVIIAIENAAASLRCDIDAE